MKRFVYIFFLAAFLGVWMPGAGAHVSDEWRNESVMRVRNFQQIDAELGSQKTLVPGLESKWIICRNDPVNMIDPTGKAANPAGMGDMPQESISGEPVWVEPYAALPITIYPDVTFTVTLQESGGGIWGGNVNAGLGFAYDGDSGNWEVGMVSTEGAGSFAGGGRSYSIELSISGGDELSDLDGTTMEIGGSVGEGPGGGGSVNVPYPAMDFEKPIIAVNFGWSMGLPAEGHCFINHTQTQPFDQTPSTNPKQEGTN